MPSASIASAYSGGIGGHAIRSAARSGPAADHGMPTDAQARHDAKAPIGVAAVPNDVPGREGAVGVAHREARDIGGAEGVGALSNPCEDGVEVVALGEVAGDAGQGLCLAATALGLGIEPRALDRDRGVAAEGREHLHLGDAEVLGTPRGEREDAHKPAVGDERNRHAGGHAHRCEVGAIDRARVGQDVGHQEGSAPSAA